ncbi:MAG: hypothetical protein EDR02_13550 [Actinobacteria bacterium]|nr:MAG: hypothetical protein EDR02_13550 [Actinomycetota bacterium]
MLAQTVALAVVIVAGPQPVSADPAGPTDYESSISDTEPAPGVELQVLGGDSFIEIVVDEGTEATVLGYEGEPYVRIDADGTVSVNRNSPARYLNEDRYQDVAVPANADADAQPEWEVVADDGTYAWHDHRTHWMVPDTLPPSVGDRSQVHLVNEWELDLVVEGEPVTVHGELFVLPAEKAWIWGALALLAAGTVLALGRRSPVVTIGISATVAGSVAVLVSATEKAAQPAALGPSPLPLALACSGLVAGALTIALARRRVGMLAAFVSAAVLAPWAVLVLGHLTKPVLPTTLNPAAAHALIALTVGAIVAVVILAGLVAVLPRTSAPTVAPDSPAAPPP